jgi:hypothetical protein
MRRGCDELKRHNWFPGGSLSSDEDREPNSRYAQRSYDKRMRPCAAVRKMKALIVEEEVSTYRTTHCHQGSVTRSY